MEKHSSILDTFIPEFHVSNLHKKRCKATSEYTFKAIEQLTFNEIPFTPKLVHLRTLTLRIFKREFNRNLHLQHNQDGIRKAILDLDKSLTWIKLYHHQKKGIVVGFIGSFWNTNPEFITLVNATEFINFNKVGFAKAVLDFRISEQEPYCEIQLETRVCALDPLSYKKLQVYWALIAPGMWFIRKMWLLALKRKAENFQRHIIH